MESLKSEPLDAVLSEYNYSVKDIRTESYKQKKGVWWIETDHSLKILKKHPNSESMLLYLLAAIEYLQDKGINIPKVLMTKNNSHYVKVGESCYILIEAVKGSNPDYNKPKELEAIVRELARFHRASVGFVPPQGAKVRRHLGRWPEEYKMRVDRLINFYSLEKNSPAHGLFGEIILREFPHFLERMEIALTGFSSPIYDAWVKKLESTGGLCHQDYAAGNILLGSSGKVYILDTDSLTVDIPARDIRKLFNKVMKKNGEWEIGMLESMLRWYQQENPLSPDEWAVVKLDLTYPHLFAGIVDKYYRRRESSWKEDKYITRLKEMIAVEKSLDSILGKYDEIVSSII